MVHAPFGTGEGKKTWPTLQAYQEELAAFMKDCGQRPREERLRKWFSKPEHAGDRWQKFMPPGHRTSGPEPPKHARIAPRTRRHPKRPR